MAARKPVQLKFAALKDFTRTKHGGGLHEGRRKLARPLAVKTPMHLVLRASKAVGPRSMLRPAHVHRISAVLVKQADENDVQVRQFANVGNHLHLIIQAKTRAGFRRFLRVITGLIARLVTGAVKGRAFGRFWDHLAFSRVLSWGRDLAATTRYVLQNTMEAARIPTRRSPRPGFAGILIGFD